ncbi:hypothetical protein FPV67DRAFT_1444597 [Lyophyllum atratum]|nr:hypothetical protein FPV67DRAFT_1444597 [Lyophyllum atratum]
MPPKKNADAKLVIKPKGSISKKVLIPEEDIAAIVRKALDNGPPSAIHIRREPKRKITDDSDIEILESPLASSPKKKQRNVPVHDAAAAPKLDDGKTASAILAALDAIKASPVDAPSSVPAALPTGRPVRQKVMSAKARESEAAALKLKTSRKSLVKVREEAAAAGDGLKGKGKPQPFPDLPDLGSASPASSDDDDSLPDVASLIRSVVPRRSGGVKLPISEDEADGEESASLGVPTKKNPFIDDEAGASDGLGDTLPSEDGEVEEDAASDAAASDDKPMSEKQESVSDGDVPGDISDADEDPDNVMQSSMQYGPLKSIYRGLCDIPQVCEVAPYIPPGGGDPDDLTTKRTPVERMIAAIREEEVPALLAGLTFMRYDGYVNMARMDMLDLTLEYGRIKTTDTKRPAVGIMLGLVTDCALISSVKFGYQQVETHRITIAPAPQEMRREQSMWGMLYEFEVIIGPTSKDGFSFSTLGEGRGARSCDSKASSAGPSTPKKGSSYAVTVKSPMAHGTSALGNPISFDRTVPMYDGRVGLGKEFLFRDADFKALPTWPRYKGNKCDIPNDYLVAVGYSLGTYAASNNSGTRYLSANVQLVIVLGTPRALAALLWVGC